jgi:hypothetical protein
LNAGDVLTAQLESVSNITYLTLGVRLQKL